MQTPKRFRLLFMLLIVTIAVPAGAWADRSHDLTDDDSDDLNALVIFGDSLSDTGNKFS